MGKVNDEDISDLSSSFVEVYKQAERAEHDGLNLICGMAYRRALEFLVRDYCVDKFPEKVSEIDTKSLSEKIKNYIYNSYFNRCRILCSKIYSWVYGRSKN